MDRQSRCRALEKKHVYDVYDSTAHHFRDVRYKAWPRVRQFLMTLEPASIVADIGCGSGKYLHINKDIFKLGCDRSAELSYIASSRQHEVLICDNLRLPYRDDVFDAVISIGVIHHLMTRERRAAALRELARVLRPGGKLMVYVWAMEQRHRKFEAQDVLVPWHFQPVTKEKRKKGDKESDGNRLKAMDLPNERSARVHRRSSGQRITPVNQCRGLRHHELGDGALPTSRQRRRSSHRQRTGSHSSSGDSTYNTPDSTVDKKSVPRSQLAQDSSQQPGLRRSSSLKGWVMNLFSQNMQAVVNRKDAQYRTNSDRFKQNSSSQGKLSDCEYKKFICQIVQEDIERFYKQRPMLEHSMSAPSPDLFAVREFPQSSQPHLRKNISLESGAPLIDCPVRDEQNQYGAKNSNGDSDHTCTQVMSHGHSPDTAANKSVVNDYSDVRSQNDFSEAKNRKLGSPVSNTCPPLSVNGFRSHGYIQPRDPSKELGIKDVAWTAQNNCSHFEYELNRQNASNLLDKCSQLFDNFQLETFTPVAENKCQGHKDSNVQQRDNYALEVIPNSSNHLDSYQELRGRCNDSNDVSIDVEMKDCGAEQTIQTFDKSRACGMQHVDKGAAREGSLEGSSLSSPENSVTDSSGEGLGGINEETDHTRRTSLSDSDTFEWAKVTEKAIEHMQTQVFRTASSSVDSITSRRAGVGSNVDLQALEDEDLLSPRLVQRTAGAVLTSTLDSHTEPGTPTMVNTPGSIDTQSFSSDAFTDSDVEDSSGMNGVLRQVPPIKVVPREASMASSGGIELNLWHRRHGPGSCHPQVEIPLQERPSPSETPTSVVHTLRDEAPHGGPPAPPLEPNRLQSIDSCDGEETKASPVSQPSEPATLAPTEGDTENTYHRYYHVFRQWELDELIQDHVEHLHILDSYYDNANWCVVAEKVRVWHI